jgi:hypothetical protein
VGYEQEFSTEFPLVPMVLMRGISKEIAGTSIAVESYAPKYAI